VKIKFCIWSSAVNSAVSLTPLSQNLAVSMTLLSQF
jgi:hypothetical protein